MSHRLVYTDQQLRAFLDEELPADSMAMMERLLRTDATLAKRLAQLCGERDAGVHSIGEIWRRHRVSCPSRQMLGNYLLKALMDDERQYIQFHLESVACRCCAANLEDLRQAQQESQSQSVARRRRYFQSSAGYLRRRD